MTPPVLICGFNRPDCLQRVFDAVRVVRPQELFLVLDAPREGREDDLKANEACKRVYQGVDWDCNVHRNYAERNMGCKRRMETGISEMFNHVEFGLVFEDDCVAHSDFFRFAAEMDKCYRDDSRIGMVASSAPSSANAGIPTNVSYYFDRFPYIWGWGTWRRAWEKYGKVAEVWNAIDKQAIIRKTFKSRERIRERIRHFDRICNTSHEEWDSLWWLSCLSEDMLCIHPTKNLMTNIGHVGLHACRRVEGVHDRVSEGLDFPLVHPSGILPNERTEWLLARQYSATRLERVVRKLKRICTIK